MMDDRARELEALYRHRYVAFRNTLATITGSRDSARDAVQEAFARALRHRRTFRAEGPLEAWVWRIAIRTAREHAARLTELPIPDVPETTLPEPHRDPALAAALAALPPRRRLVVFLRYFADLSYGEIAAVCGITEGTVAATLAQSHEALERQLDPKEVSDDVAAC
jgi:RNA polymerase sigma-70 factor (ECF subfamily)